MTTLICPCGRRLNIRGVPPGKRGRCPSCGEFVRVLVLAADIESEEEEWSWQGTYGIEVENPAENPPSKEEEWNWDGLYDVAEPPPPVVAPKPISPVTREKLQPEPEDASLKWVSWSDDALCDLGWQTEFAGSLLARWL